MLDLIVRIAELRIYALIDAWRIVLGLTLVLLMSWGIWLWWVQ